MNPDNDSNEARPLRRAIKRRVTRVVNSGNEGRQMKRILLLISTIMVWMPMTSSGNLLEIDSFKNYTSYRLGDNALFLDPSIVKVTTIAYGSLKDVYSKITFQVGNPAISISIEPETEDDPAFVVKIDGNVKRLSGSRLYISSAGYFYLANQADTSFDKKQKYEITSGTLKEVRQPFYLIDMSCETSAPLSIYEGKCNKGHLIAKIPEKSSVRIIAVENIANTCPQNILPHNDAGDPIDSYLVSTPFGLVGWAVSTSGYFERPGKPLGCLRHN